MFRLPREPPAEAVAASEVRDYDFDVPDHSDALLPNLVSDGDQQAVFDKLWDT